MKRHHSQEHDTASVRHHPAPEESRMGRWAAQLSASPRMQAQRRQIEKSFGSAAQHVSTTAPGKSTGMPDALKTGMEALSGVDLSAVRVHRDSAKPAQLNALAFAQGKEIYLGPQQERHLPHEAWHIVQQTQGRVSPTRQMMNATINDDPALEREADQMGERATNMAATAQDDLTAQRVATAPVKSAAPPDFETVQRKKEFRGQGAVNQDAWDSLWIQVESYFDNSVKDWFDIAAKTTMEVPKAEEFGHRSKRRGEGSDRSRSRFAKLQREIWDAARMTMEMPDSKALAQLQTATGVVPAGLPFATGSPPGSAETTWRNSRPDGVRHLEFIANDGPQAQRVARFQEMADRRPVQRVLSVAKNVVTYRNEIGIEAYDKGDENFVREFNYHLIVSIADKVPLLREFIQHQGIKVSIIQGLHVNDAKNVDYVPEKRLHQTIEAIGKPGPLSARGPKWHINWEVRGQEVVYTNCEQTNAVDGKAFLEANAGFAVPSINGPFEYDSKKYEKHFSSGGASKEETGEKGEEKVTSTKLESEPRQWHTFGNQSQEYNEKWIFESLQASRSNPTRLMELADVLMGSYDDVDATMRGIYKNYLATILDLVEPHRDFFPKKLLKIQRLIQER